MPTNVPQNDCAVSIAYIECLRLEIVWNEFNNETRYAIAAMLSPQCEVHQ
jgi:hypothetical protein